MASHAFSLSDIDSSTTALSPSDPSPGTWPAAIAFTTGGDALISRHNIRSLIQLNAKLDVIGRLPIPGGLSTPGDVVDANGDVFVAPYAGEGATVVFSESGALLGSARGGTIRLSRSDANVFGIGLNGVARLMPNGSASSLLPALGSLNDRIFVAAQELMIYRDGPGTIDALRYDGSQVATLTLKNAPVQVVNPFGSSVSGYDRDSVSALVSDQDGSIWYIDATRPALVHLRF
jgi:hypothetical protein